MQLISSAQAYHYRIIPVASSNGNVTFKTDQVSDNLAQELQIILDKDIQLQDASTESIQQYLSVNFRP